MTEWSKYREGGDTGPVRTSAGLMPGEQVIRFKQNPSTFERTVRVIRDLLACLALLLASILMALLLVTGAAIVHGLQQTGDSGSVDPGPAPTATGCPFGPGQCGG